LAHTCDELIGELLIATTSRKAELLARIDVALGGLAIDTGSLGDDAHSAVTPQPPSKNL
jgi:hypothetical protein